MNIKQIKYFAAVVERGSLSAAAKDLYITVQAVSKTIADLERELGCDLFARVNQGMRPTPFALAFYEKAAAVLAAFGDLETFSASYREPEGKLKRLRLALNTPPFVGNETVRENTAALIGRQLGIECIMVLATGPKGLEGLREEKFDVLVTVGAFNHDEVECHAVGTVPSAVMMRKGHLLAGLETVSLKDLAPYPVALSSWFDEANDTIVGRYREKGAELNLNFVHLELDDIGSHFDAGGVVFTTGIPALEKSQPTTVVRELAPEDVLAVPICVVYLRSRSESVTATIEGMLAEGLPSLGCPPPPSADRS